MCERCGFLKFWWGQLKRRERDRRIRIFAQGVSSSIDSDEYFKVMMQNAWRLKVLLPRHQNLLLIRVSKQNRTTSF